jgi:hypothetical protein
MNRIAVLNNLIEFKGNVPHMYRCTGAKVTVGVGRALETVEDACTLKWRLGARAKSRDHYGLPADQRCGNETHFGVL